MLRGDGTDFKGDEGFGVQVRVRGYVCHWVVWAIWRDYGEMTMMACCDGHGLSCQPNGKGWATESRCFFVSFSVMGMVAGTW